MERMTLQEQSRFRSKYSKGPKGCWLWKGPLDKDGYGTYLFRRANRRAHRVSYWNSVGDIPAGYVIHHNCQNRHCINPEHLEPMTAKQNSSAKYRGNTCKRGHEFDREYSGQRYCSICDKAKSKRLRAKWKKEGIIKI